jgi:hypothetical protein
MLTIFSTPKPFHGHIGVIQRNALRSWTLLDPEVQVILFGDDAGASEIAKELGIRHESEIRRAEQGTKYLDYLFDRAQQIAQHDVLCYVNCDIMLTTNFRDCVERVAALRRPFLMVGHRWDIDIAEPWDFKRRDWGERLNATASQHGKQRPSWFIDYFVFTRGLYRDLPPLVIGRVGWDNWLIWKARSQKVLVVDASECFKAVHQNHDYSYHPAGAAGVWTDELARRNYELAGGMSHIFTIDDATHRIAASWKIVRTPLRKKLVLAKNLLFDAFVHRTFRLRERLGMRRQGWLGSLLRSAGAGRDSRRV